jgi:uncharacterized protein (DUF433 family)
LNLIALPPDKTARRNSWLEVAETEWGVVIFMSCAIIQGMSERIEINPRVCGGQPVIKGTRIPVSAILEQLADGESWDSILRGYPELTRADIQAALHYARHSVLHTEITAVGAA